MNFSRRKTISVPVGNVQLGSDFPIRIQSMTNTHTTQVKESVEQTKKMIANGCEIVRFAMQGKREVESLRRIKEELSSQNINIPLVADVHFNASVANIAAEVVDKVRVNPGNYAKKEAMEEKFSQLLEICKKHGTSIRVGVNHGSLSERILQKYGNTPEGMVESCMEFLRICKNHAFSRVVVSMKASNAGMMVKSNRLLVKQMQKEQLPFPLHLGVTEAGGGEAGRIKSAIGVGTLLNEGIGDTIRISLTEDPGNEPIFAHKIVQYISRYPPQNYVSNGSLNFPFRFTSFYKRETHQTAFVGSAKVPVVLAKPDPNIQALADTAEDIDFYFVKDTNAITSLPANAKCIVPFKSWQKKKNYFPLLSAAEFLTCDYSVFKNETVFVESELNDLSQDFFRKVNSHPTTILIAKTKKENPYPLFLAYFHLLFQHSCKAPVILRAEFSANDKEDFQLKAAVSLGGLFIDGLANGIFLESNSSISNRDTINTSFEVLQGAGVRMSKAEFISCPGCGRTFFELEKVSIRVKTAFEHLKTLKIAVMGCIVNGIGEMGDADYGYVGSATDKINLYKGKEIVARNIPDNQAIEKLTEIIKSNNDWKEK